MDLFPVLHVQMIGCSRGTGGIAKATSDRVFARFSTVAHATFTDLEV
jgi:hypothetical protein